MEKYQSSTLHHWELLTSRQQPIPSQFHICYNSLSETHQGCQQAPTENDLYWPTAADQESAFAMRLQDCISSIPSEFPLSLLVQVKVKQLLDTPSCWHLSWMEHSRAGQVFWMGQNFQPQEATVWIILPPNIPANWEPGNASHWVKIPLGNFSPLWGNQGP